MRKNKRNTGSGLTLHGGTIRPYLAALCLFFLAGAAGADTFWKRENTDSTFELTLGGGFSRYGFLTTVGLGFDCGEWKNIDSIFQVYMGGLIYKEVDNSPGVEITSDARFGLKYKVYFWSWGGVAVSAGLVNLFGDPRPTEVSAGLSLPFTWSFMELEPFVDVQIDVNNLDDVDPKFNYGAYFSFKAKLMYMSL